MRDLDPVLKLLTGLIVFFTIALIGIAVVLKDDGQTFQVMGNVLSGFVGALLMRVKTDTSPDVKPGTQRETVTVEKQATPPVATPAPGPNA